MITQSRLKELFYFHPESGDFVRLVRTSRRFKAGGQAGALGGEGYRHIKIDGKFYYSHRLAWLYEHGAFPPDQIDHINGIKTDNRLVNLRSATHAENQHNCPAPAHNTSGEKGVSWNKAAGKWCARIKVNNIQKHLGYFDIIGEAAAAYATASEKYFGEFAHRDTASG